MSPVNMSDRAMATNRMFVGLRIDLRRRMTQMRALVTAVTVATTGVT